MEAGALLEGLNDAQRRAVTSDAAPLCILAGAGTGKTRVLTRRIAYRCATGAADPRHVIALTFTRKAAGELASRLRALGLRDRLAAGTFHALAYAQLRNHWADKGQTPPELLERKLPVLARAVRGLSFKGFQLVDVIGEIEWAKARLVSPARYPEEAAKAGRHPPLAPSRWPTSTSATSSRSATSARSTSTTSSGSAPPPSSATPTSAPPSAGSSATSSSTSSRTSTRCSCGCCRLGAATGPTSASSATPTRRSTRGTEPTPGSSASSHGTSPAARPSR